MTEITDRVEYISIGDKHGRIQIPVKTLIKDKHDYVIEDNHFVGKLDRIDTDFLKTRVWIKNVMSGEMHMEGQIYLERETKTKDLSVYLNGIDKIE